MFKQLKLELFGKKKFSFTNPLDPKIEVNTEKGIKTYLDNLEKISFEELCEEFCYVMAAKYNLTRGTGMFGFNEYATKQPILTDLTDKATLICIYLFGHKTLMQFSNNDMRVINQLINTLDNQVAAYDLEPREHGKYLIEMLKKYILN